MIAANTVAAANVAADVATQAELDAKVPNAGEVTATMLATTLDLSSKTLTLSAAQKAEAYLEYREEQTSATDGGTFTSGAWQLRTLNTEAFDTGSHGALATNKITLAAGTYECDIRCPAVLVNEHQARLYNATDAAVVLLGQLAYSNTGGGAAVITGRFTIGASKALQVEHRGAVTRATDGFGAAGGWGTEVYTVARFWKVG